MAPREWEEVKKKGKVGEKKSGGLESEDSPNRPYPDGVISAIIIGVYYHIKTGG